MRSKRWLEIGVVVVIVVILAAILYPVTQRSGSSAREGEAYGLLWGIRQALRHYSRDHNGQLPASLAALYPRYSDDQRIKQSFIISGDLKMTVVYYRPERLGDPKTPVAEVRPYPTVEKRSRYSWRGFVLWGDMQIRKLD